MKFVDVFIGWPGATHDARVWKNSQIFSRLQNNPLDNEYHLLGDSAYPITASLLAPFKDNGHLSIKQRTFNRILSSTRVIIEQAFGLLKTRFRRLKYLDVNEIKNASRIVYVGCILHNICQMNGDDLLLAPGEFFDDPDNGGHNEDAEDAEESSEMNGFDKREEICEELSH